MATGWDDYDPDDYWDDHESPEEYEAAQLRAEEPPDSYFEEQAEREHQLHADAYHGGGECDCSPWEPPRCRWWLRVPRWTHRHRWHCGTPYCCAVEHHRTLRGALRAHRWVHQPDEPPF